MTGPWNNPVPVGSMIAGKYRVERVIGVGGMGTVLAAMHIDLEELRAIKVMRPLEGDSTLAVERFMREARAVVRLKSEHVARVYDVGRTDSGLPFIVMEYLHGADLSYIARKRGQLPIAEVAVYVIQACDAIAEAHAAGIIHRDLKPANLFVTMREDGSPCVKVLDFGISKRIGGEGSDMEMTSAHEVLGSPYYMSPEQMRSTRDASERSDVWALGVILYRLTTGKLPFPAETPVELCAKILETFPEPPRSIRPDIPAELDAIILRCLEKDPANRMPSVRELAAALLPFAHLEALDLPPMSRRLGVTITSSGLTPAAGLLASARAAVAGEPATSGAWGGHRKLDRSPAAPVRSRRDLALGAAFGALGVAITLVIVFFSLRGGSAPAAGASEPPAASAVAEQSAAAVGAAPVAALAALQPPTSLPDSVRPTAEQAAAVREAPPVQAASAAPTASSSGRGSAPARRAAPRAPSQPTSSSGRKLSGAPAPSDPFGRSRK